MKLIPLPFGKKYYSLKATRDLEPLKANRFEWHASSDDSHFVMHGCMLHRGWSMIEVMLEHSVTNGTVRFYFDTGHGFSEEESIFLPLRPGRISKRLCYLPATLKTVRINPLESKGDFTIHHFRFVWLPPWFAQDRLAKRLKNTHHLFHNQTKRSVLNFIKSEARLAGIHWRELALARYNETFIRKCPSRSYSSWIADVENLHRPSEFAIKQFLEVLSLKPIISILLPTYNSDKKLLCKCIESVLNQSYSHWQLCIADDASSISNVRELVKDYATKDDRIQLNLRDSNGHIVEASNSALKLATGDYITLLDHDDLLSEHALLKVVQSINKKPDAAVIYSDEDKVDAEGNRFDPHFKPDWNLDLLLSQNYISHLGVYRAELIHAVGGFREGVEGSQDHDLLLRCVSMLNAGQVVHIPEILYHWRAIEGSTAEKPEEKGYTTAAGVKALNDFHSQSASGATVESGRLPNTYRTHWPIPDVQPLVSLIIPTRDGYEVLKRCLDSILEKTTYGNYEILIMNNQSRCAVTLQYLEAISVDKKITVLNWNNPFNYSAINNYGVTKVNGTIIGLLNNDVEVINPDWLNEMVSHACRDDIGCVGAKLYYPNETVQHGGVILGIGGVAGHSHKYFSRNEHGYFSRLELVQNLSAVTGACLLVRKAVFEQVGGLEEENLAVAFNDVDLCLKVREAGYRNLWTPYAELYHHESHTRGQDDTLKKRNRALREVEYMRKRWGTLLDNDPAYNPNLSLVHEDYSLR